jgi:hypothetical protein
LDNTKLNGKANLTVSSGQSSEKTYIDENGNLVVGDDQTAGALTISGETTDKNGTTVNGEAEVVVINPGSTNIKEKFGVTQEGKDGVYEAFRELSAFIEKGGLTDPKTKDVIKLGNYIELEGGLSVEPYLEEGGYSSADDPGWDTEITGSGVSMGQMNRLIVVGINSFKDNGSYKYPKGSSEPDPSDHVVFQFQNVPVQRRMNANNDNAGGYPKSDMRKYLTENFFAGLEKAGVPTDVLWGPSRVMATKRSPETETINDLLWLPTEREIYGDISYLNDDIVFNRSAAAETEANQAKLAYYRQKFLDEWGTLTKDDFMRLQKASKTTSNYPNVGNTRSPQYWLASASNDTSEFFCVVDANGTPGVNRAGAYAYGVAPAFCVKGWPKTEQ